MVKQTIQIFGRIKPAKNATVVYSVDNDEPAGASLEFLVPRDVAEGFVNNKRECYKFRFLKVFDQAVKQEDIFENIAKPVADSVLAGYNGTVFAYGQTDSGKTFTITGGAERYSDRGIIPRTLSYLFQRVSQFQPLLDFQFQPLLDFQFQPLLDFQFQPLLDFQFQPLLDFQLQPLLNFQFQPLLDFQFQPLLDFQFQPLLDFQLQPLLLRLLAARSDAQPPVCYAPQDSSMVYTIHISYLEIYNEMGYDLLDSRHEASRLEDLPKVLIMEDPDQNIHLRNLSLQQSANEEEALNLLFLGDTNRIIAETPMNQASTRSHCIFTVHMCRREPGSATLRRSKLNLVDLAGSDRVSKTSLNGQLLTEAKYINLSLHYLEQVIIALSEKSRSHIPYRNSMLTSVLRDSLGGNCMTTMIATMSVDKRNLDESISTCRFAQRVALIKNEAVLNEELDPALIGPRINCYCITAEHYSQSESSRLILVCRTRTLSTVMGRFQDASTIFLLIARLKREIQSLKEELAMMTGEQREEQLTVEEIQRLEELVKAFLEDPDPDVTLSLGPDMRRIQHCFSLLKMLSESINAVVCLFGRKSDVSRSAFSARRANAACEPERSGPPEALPDPTPTVSHCGLKLPLSPPVSPTVDFLFYRRSGSVVQP
ncbi:Kinesin-like protein KIF6 [Liparis tanakae]|uniref:Kinesin-like protein KIF6 n=1 Tax=Liparis tanakae TaxID=230148 RepID=A0A4Z2HKL7_9TELE|nr:Kinesin-like protein KIF6 [Liparis tanakae]